MSAHDDRVKAMIDGAMSKAMALAEPKGIYFGDNIIELTADEVALSCGFRVRSKLLSRLLRGCVEAALFAADLVIIPAACDSASLTGVSLAISTNSDDINARAVTTARPSFPALY